MKLSKICGFEINKIELLHYMSNPFTYMSTSDISAMNLCTLKLKHTCISHLYDYQMWMSKLQNR